MILFAVVIILVSRESHTVYFYSRLKSRVMTRNAVAQMAPHQVTVMIPFRPHEESKVEEEVVCDSCFLTAIKIALGGTEDLKLNVSKICTDHWNMVDPRKVTKVIKFGF